jgi:hypothetical protein
MCYRLLVSCRPGGWGVFFLGGKEEEKKEEEKEKEKEEEKPAAVGVSPALSPLFFVCEIRSMAK